MATQDDLVPVRLLVSVASAEHSWVPGQVVHLPRAEAAKWADGQRGEYVEQPAQPQPQPPTGTRGGTEIETTQASPRPAGTRKGRRSGAGTETT